MKRTLQNLPGKLFSFAILLAGAVSGTFSQAGTGVPAVFNFSPASGSKGTIVAISGTNFIATAAANIVYFGAVQTKVSSASPTNLIVTAPSGATFGPITVTAGGLTAYSGQLFEPTFTGGN